MPDLSTSTLSDSFGLHTVARLFGVSGGLLSFGAQGMQLCADERDSHIITACNANKKLSFHGWDKCVEAFSQGKGHLSHRCSQLMSQPQQDISHLDVAISWSSSDEECEDASMPQVRQRPNRLLSSQINFDDCKPVQKKGRRHSSALFVRSIEKRHKEITDRKGSEPTVNQQADCSNILDSTVTHNENSNNGSESFDEHLWIKNVSILNQRINISSDCSETFPLRGTIVNDAESLSPAKKTISKFEAASPILRPCGLKNKKATFHKHSNEMKEEVVLNETALNHIPNSPVFKTNTYRRRSRLKTPHTSKKTNDLACDQKPSPCASTTKTDSKAAYKEDNLRSPPKEDAPVSATDLSARNDISVAPVILTSANSPQTLKNGAEIAISPIIGKSSRKRPRPAAKAKMVIEQSISPILVSKSKPRSRRSSKFDTLDHNSCNMVKHGAEKLSATLDDSLNKLSFLYEPSGLNSTLLDNNFKSKPLVNQCTIPAKRSLDFSLQNVTEETNINDCDTKEALPLSNSKTTDTTLLTLGHESLQTEAATNEFEMSQDELQVVNDSINYSRLIEEINTEQPDYDDVQAKLLKTPVLPPQKKKKLSLSKKKSTSSNKKEQIAILPVSKIGNDFVQKWKKNGFENPKQVESLQVLEGTSIHTSELRRDLHAGPSKLTKQSSNHTLFIEEEYSEPMDSPQNITVVDFKGSTSKPDISTKFDIPIHLQDHSEYVDKNVNGINDFDDVDIVSCSSQGARGSQLTQIEKLPSSCVSSPLTISQSSSPPAPTDHRAIEAGSNADDFNAPPKKGKKKLKPDGLASRLQRLLNRQRSSARIWQYQRSKRGKCSSAVSSESASSMLLLVERTWTEYSHVLVQGYVHNDVSGEKGERCLGSPSSFTILVIDTCVAEKLGKIVSATKIQIFPPWQGLKVRGISLILCAYRIEVVSALPVDKVPRTRKSEVSISLKEGFESIGGVSLSDIIFPKVVEKPHRLFQCMEVIVDELNDTLEDHSNLGTISALVSNHYTGNAISDGIKLTVLRIFHFNQAVTDNQETVGPSWSLLGQDVTKEVCEVILGSKQPLSSDRSIWQDVESEQIVGKTFTFFGFLPIQRIAPFRVSNLWKIVSSMDVLGPCEQPVLYVLAAANSVWECQPTGKEHKFDMYQPHFTSLTSILSENVLEPRRVDVLTRLIHVTNERLYLTDVETYPNIVHVTVNPSAYLSPLTAKASVIAVLDLESVAGELKADKYTRISAVHDENLSVMSSVLNEEYFRCLACLNPDLPILQRSTPTRSLVKFFGVVVGVDEDSAYMWPACGICENELLSLGDQSEKYRCEKCNDQGENFILRMSLQVLCTCPSLPKNSSVRLKLLQSTIESLLPPTVSGEEGYDMNAVLGQTLGPLRCEVINSKDSNFVLQEFC